MRKIYNKLVRDNIIDIILNDNGKPVFKILNDDNFRIALKNKVVEESQELLLANTKDDVINELSDIIELIETISKNYNINKDELLNKKENKKLKRGGFDKKIFLEYSDEDK